MINKFLNATGPFLPQIGETAAMKLAIASILASRDLEWIIYLLDEEDAHNEFEGEPGWNIIRRDPSRWNNREFQGWPADASYRAYVDPTELRLKFPECFMSRRQFVAELSGQFDLYLAVFPADPSVNQVVSRLSGPGRQGSGLKSS